MEIRNQFMHNFDAVSYEKCYEFLSGTDNAVLKLYPQTPAQSKEARLKKATHSLCMEVEQLTMSIIDKVRDRRAIKTLNEVNQIVHDGLLKSIQKTAEFITDLADNEIANGAHLDRQIVTKIGVEAQNHLINSYITLVNEGLNKNLKTKLHKEIAASHEDS